MILILIVWTICAAIGASMATKRNRNEVLWGGICFLTGVFGIAVLALMGNARKEAH